jgi:lysophospholipase L1-like esterase
MKFSVVAFGALSVSCVLAHDGLPINPELGVPGFPDCYLPSVYKAEDLTVDEAAHALVCEQVQGRANAKKVGCIGDSITAGVHSSGGNHTYPAQLQILLGEEYVVTNLGACGSTMLKKSNSPYWDRPQYKTLIENKWDIITIMLGTNDAKDPGDHGPNNWLHNCGGVDNTKITGCSFAADFAAMIAEVRTLGTQPDGPDIYIAIPPPLMEQYSIGANQTVINSVYPILIPLIGKANKIENAPIDVYSGMGGVVDWESQFPESCQLHSPWKPCAWWCDQQSCDQCHPNNDGYAHMATIFDAALTKR